jgi:hypothetical protein
VGGSTLHLRWTQTTGMGRGRVQGPKHCRQPSCDAARDLHRKPARIHAPLHRLPWSCPLALRGCAARRDCQPDKPCLRHTTRPLWPSTPGISPPKLRTAEGPVGPSGQKDGESACPRPHLPPKTPAEVTSTPAPHSCETKRPKSASHLTLPARLAPFVLRDAASPNYATYLMPAAYQHSLLPCRPLLQQLNSTFIPLTPAAYCILVRCRRIIHSYSPRIIPVSSPFLHCRLGGLRSRLTISARPPNSPNKTVGSNHTGQILPSQPMPYNVPTAFHPLPS